MNRRHGRIRMESESATAPPARARLRSDAHKARRAPEPCRRRRRVFVRRLEKEA